jgi:hypothetical protein
MPTRAFRIVDSGIEASSFSTFASQQRGFVSSSLILVHRAGVSDRILYKFFLYESLRRGAIVVFPLVQHSFAGIDLEGKRLRPIEIFRDKNWESKKNLFLSGNMYKFHTKSQEDCAVLLSRLREIISTGKENHSEQNIHSIIFIVDTLQKWEHQLEFQLRELIGEASTINVNLWLHCPLDLIPTDLISTIGNVIVVWPTVNEINILSNYLPLVQHEYSEFELSRGMLFCRSIPSKEENRWQLVNLNKEY